MIRYQDLFRILRFYTIKLYPVKKIHLISINLIRMLDKFIDSSINNNLLQKEFELLLFTTTCI